MLIELYRTGQQLLHMIGMCLLIWGVFSLIGGYKALVEARWPVA